jgi:hypothetical protein
MLNCYYNNNVSKFPYPVYVDDLVVNVQKKIIISIILVKFSLGNYGKKNCPLTSSTFNISLLWIIIYPKVKIQYIFIGWKWNKNILRIKQQVF